MSWSAPPPADPEVAGPASHAEVEQVWVDLDRIRVLGRLPAAEPAQRPSRYEARLLLTSRERPDARLLTPAVLAGDRFDAAVGTGELAEATALATETWDLYLAIGANRPIRIGRHLDDIRDKKRVMTFPARRAGVGDRAFRVRVRYTVKNNLCVTATRLLDPAAHDPAVHDPAVHDPAGR